MKKIKIYDTTLRDGLQGQGLNLSVDEKIKAIHLLDDLGIDYIEAGFLGSNSQVKKLFDKLENISLDSSRIAAFGMTRKKDTAVADDKNLLALKESWVPVITLVGKTWGLHIDKVLETTKKENLSMITESIWNLDQVGKEVHYDAEHFFDAYKDNPRYALQCIAYAWEAGAEWVTLCDTNGATLPQEISRIVSEVREALPEDAKNRLAIHAHNDSETAVANSLAAIESGARLVQGTINGYGERTGNTNLLSLVPDLDLKSKDFKTNINLRKITQISYAFDELLNQTSNPNQPYVGAHAFAHKGGMHAAGILKDSSTFEHIDPEEVGNKRHIALSELSGKATVESFLKNIDATAGKKEIIALTKLLKHQEVKGYSYESAEASFELLVKKELGEFKPFWELEDFKVLTHKRGAAETEATLKLLVSGERLLEVAEGNGPVNALDNALRQALSLFYPEINRVELINYKVRIIDSDHGTEARTRVILETRDKLTKETWSTVGVSTNIIEASWQTLDDSLNFFLSKNLKN